MPALPVRGKPGEVITESSKPFRSRGLFVPR